MNKLYLLLIVLLVAGCSSVGSPFKKTASLTEEEAALFESVVADNYQSDSQSEQHIYYLRWTKHANQNQADRITASKFRDFPDSFHRKISYMPSTFKKASEIVEGWRHRDPTTRKEGRMLWLSIDKWNSETEVEVEVSLDFGTRRRGSTSIYVKVDGEWQREKLVESWSS